MAPRTTRSPSTAADRANQAPAATSSPDRKRSLTMQPRRPIQRFARAAAAAFITAGAVAGISSAGAQAAAIPSAAAAPCVAWTGGEQPSDPGGTSQNNTLWGVAVLSRCNAWAVGDYDPGQTQIGRASC